MANPRFFGKKDLDTFDRVNKELIGDLNNANSGIIDQTVIVYKISASNTETNMYGETSDGKVFKPGVEIACLVEAEDMEFNTDEFGPDLRQNATFSFVRQSLRDLSLVLEIGDVVEWFTAYWEITNINENQLVGGQYEQLDGQHIHSVICSANLLRRSNLNIEEVRSI
jgi:hypothetical protein